MEIPNPGDGTTRRGLLAALLAGGTGATALTPAGSYLDRFAPLSGRAWAAATRREGGTVESPYGDATLRYDDEGVANVTAGGDRALYYAVGYAHANDRLFQMDLQRRLMAGRLAAVVGPVALDSDRFHRKMDFRAAAAATWSAIESTRTGPLIRAYADGVNAYLRRKPLPMEFGLVGYEPDRWHPVDTILMEKLISWNLTGDFRTLRKELARAKLGVDTAERLYPVHLDHEVPIDRGGDGDGDAAGGSVPSATRPTVDPRRGAVDTDLLAVLDRFGADPGTGSNSWVVSGEHTDSGEPILANDPHLRLSAPPTWYEQNLRTEQFRVRGVTFPGVPFVVIGENHAGAWGFTNTGADVIDFYTYDTDEARERYRYRGSWRDFETTTERIAVDDAPDRSVTVRKSVHGPVLDREELVGDEGALLGVAWTGLAATESMVAIDRFARSDGFEEFLGALSLVDSPTQNVVYADRDGRTLWYVTGKIPIRRVDGDTVRGDRIFDGSAAEAEWDGFTPYGRPTWEGFVPFAEKPGGLDPGYVATANQRVTDDPEYYLGQGFAAPFRGMRIYDRLDRRAASDRPMDPSFLEDVQLDVLDERARRLVPAVLDARDRMTDRARTTAGPLEGWDFRMARDSRAALVFAFFLDRFRERTWAALADAGLRSPNDWVLLGLDPDSEWFDGDRAGVIAAAMDDAAARIDEAGYDTYGEYNTTDFSHPFEQSFLAYPAYPTDGSPGTVRNLRVQSGHGSSWRMVCPMAEGVSSRAILPGGNDGDYFSTHYHDQLQRWADGRYKPMSLQIDGDPLVQFRGGDS